MDGYAVLRIGENPSLTIVCKSWQPFAHFGEQRVVYDCAVHSVPPCHICSWPLSPHQFILE